jgi:benzoate-CoA ligase family protein
MKSDVSTTGTSATNNAANILEQNVAAAAVDNPYLRTRERVWSYAEVHGMAQAAGAGFRELGLDPGDRVILSVRDRPEFVAGFWGAIKAGLVPVPVAPMLAASDLHFILTDSDARIVVSDTSSIVAARSAIEETKADLVSVDTAGDGRTWAEVCTRAASLETVATREDDIALWLYTSGTTGLPKAVMHRHRSVFAATQGLAAQVLGMSADDVVLSVSRMFFAYGLGNSVYLPASVGASVVLGDAPVVPATIAQLLSAARPTLLFGVPAFFRGFLGLEDATLPSSVRAVVSAGEALSADVLDRFSSAFGRPLVDGLGSTEALHHITSNRLDDIVAGSAGRPLNGYAVQARDREGRVLPDGETGELWVRGPTTFAAYWRRPELTDRAYDGDWMRTGDRVRILDDRVFHEGRLDDLVKLGGIWVAPTEIEDVLRSHPGVNDAAVVAIDDGSGVPVLKAFVVSDGEQPNLSRDLRRLARGRLASYKIPQVFEVVPDLPRTPSGKLRRFVLRGAS